MQKGGQPCSAEAVQGTQWLDGSLGTARTGCGDAWYRRRWQRCYDEAEVMDFGELRVDLCVQGKSDQNIRTRCCRQCAIKFCYSMGTPVNGARCQVLTRNGNDYLVDVTDRGRDVEDETRNKLACHIDVPENRIDDQMGCRNQDVSACYRLHIDNPHLVGCCARDESCSSDKRCQEKSFPMVSNLHAG